MVAQQVLVFVRKLLIPSFIQNLQFQKKRRRTIPRI